MKALNVIRKPVITEKSSQLEEKQVYAFWVNEKATKIDIKNAFRTLYGADVAKVRILKNPAKMRKIAKGSFNKRPENMKVYVSLKGKAKLDVNKFEKADKESKVKLALGKSKAATKEKKASKTTTKKTK